MDIVYGDSPTQKKLGYVADFCPICHSVETFMVVAIGQTRSLYFVSLSRKSLGEVMVCKNCGVAMAATLGDYTMVAKSEAVPEVLMETTFPNLETARAERLALEARIPTGLSAEERARLLFEPFELLHPIVEARYANSGEMDTRAARGCLATIAIPIAIVWIGSYFRAPGSNTPLIVAAIVGGIMLLYSIVQIGLAPGRFMRNVVLCQLAMALSPLEPQEEELARCLEKCRSLGWKLGKKVKPQQIRETIEAYDQGLPPF